MKKLLITTSLAISSIISKAQCIKTEILQYRDLYTIIVYDSCKVTYANKSLLLNQSDTLGFFNASMAVFDNELKPMSKFAPIGYPKRFDRHSDVPMLIASVLAAESNVMIEEALEKVGAKKN
jgi:hypothetical protein